MTDLLGLSWIHDHKSISFKSLYSFYKSNQIQNRSAQNVDRDLEHRMEVLRCLNRAIKSILKFQFPSDDLSNFPETSRFSLYSPGAPCDELFGAFFLPSASPRA